jgi:5,10-methylene-tetrahydrofolate dehydrogenase/methenyl tetrahydrofolate cyclohydrolase
MGVAAYSAAAAMIIIRTLFLSVGIADNLWVGSVVYRVTDPVARALQLVPGGDFELVGKMTVADWTMLAFVVLVPAIIVARRPEY